MEGDGGDGVWEEQVLAGDERGCCEGDRGGEGKSVDAWEDPGVKRGKGGWVGEGGVDARVVRVVTGDGNVEGCYKYRKSLCRVLRPKTTSGGVVSSDSLPSPISPPHVRDWLSVENLQGRTYCGAPSMPCGD